MPIQWKTAEAKDRLLAAVIASSGTVNMNEVARLFGQEATYDAVEGQLRKCKKLANELKAEATGREGPAVATSRIKNSADSGKKTAVKGARVSKSQKATNLKIDAKLIKKELYDSAMFGETNDEDDEEV